GVDLNFFSESFASTATEVASVEPGEKESAELPSGKQPQKPTWDMSCESWVDADFSGAKNLHEKFSSSNIQRCKFIGSGLSGLLLKSNNIEQSDFSDSDMSNSLIQRSYLDHNQFKHCSLKEATFSGTYIKGCDFSGANFTGAEVTSGAFLNCTTANAVWHHTSFVRTQIENIVFEGTLEDCRFENCAFDMVTFQRATLINTFFKNKSLKWVRFIDCQADRMTYEFLKKNGQVDLTGISPLPATI
ncbi:pentapeptide repeat-containing protein, partial [Chitinophaga sp.]|uniref:pentapeptide repeat-containing protein n=1 Tax=Chitinophaga sp. TaxID=1869181 RepID=UPI002F93CABD